MPLNAGASVACFPTCALPDRKPPQRRERQEQQQEVDEDLGILGVLAVK